MSASVSSWLVFADKLRLRSGVGSAPLRPRRSPLSIMPAPEHARAPALSLNFILWCQRIILSAPPFRETPSSLLFGPRRRIPSPGFAARASTLIRF